LEEVGCNIDHFSLLMSSGTRISGYIHDIPFNITLRKEEYFLISAKEESILAKIQPVLTEYMGGKSPICKYSLITEGVSMPTLEWDCIDPKQRIVELINGSAYSGATIENLQSSDFSSIY
jgi:hypothetical protein